MLTVNVLKFRTLKLRTPKIIAENNFKNILKNRTLTFFEKVEF